MLGLVLSSNIFQIYFFWELVGVSSYLLIGFYYDRPSAVMACKKAFIVTRFADFGFLIGILVLSYYTGSLDFQTILERLSSPESSETGMALQASFLGISALSWGLILVFIGGAGKSALFPLHIWLPDAMEGPTPVSALIHAATMVVAGVFLVARLFPVYAISGPGVLESVAWVGVISALIAALIACTQTDIKRVLAYSTMSQIGYMIFALGVSGYGGGNNGDIGLGYTASLFHLFTHALFKALLFLGAGVVIHYVHSNEIRDMGGLKKKLPVTHICFLIACLAIAGVPPFSGFFSKEEILYAAWLHEPAIFFIGLISSGITAFYMFRLYFGIFHSRTYKGHETANHAEGGPAILIPLVLLAIGAATAGFIPFGHFVSSDGKPLDMPFHLRFSLAPVLLGLTGILLAGWLYASGSDRPEKIRLALGGFYRLLYRKFYIDEIYLFVTRKFLFNIIGRAAAWTDKNVVDGLVDLLGAATRGLSVLLRGMQSGKVQQYALYFLGGALALAFLFIYVWK
jgi:NADH-quinone oxidoreductase subunit L